MKNIIKKAALLALLLLSVKVSQCMFGGEGCVPTFCFSNEYTVQDYLIENGERELQKLRKQRDELPAFIADIMELKERYERHEKIYVRAMKEFIILDKKIKSEEELGEILRRSEASEYEVLLGELLKYSEEIVGEIELKIKKAEGYIAKAKEEKAKLEDQLKNKIENPDDCAICCGRMKSNPRDIVIDYVPVEERASQQEEEEEGPKVRIWCGHAFHRDCIDRWIVQKGGIENATCPHCRKKKSDCIDREELLQDMGRDNQQQNNQN